MKVVFALLSLLLLEGIQTSSSTLRGSSEQRHLDVPCPLTYEMKCTSDNKPCSTLEKAYTACDDHPTMMMLRYHGGTCDQGYNSQPVELFECTDAATTENGTTTLQLDDEVFIHVFKDEITYFRGPVSLGGDIVLEDPTNATKVLPNDMNVTIYQDELGTVVAQSFFFHTSCERSLFLNDYFGATQIIGFENAAQGLVSNWQEASLDIMVVLHNSGGPAIQLTKIQVSHEEHHLTVETFVNDTLQSGENTTASLQVTLDVDKVYNDILVEVFSDTCNVSEYESLAFAGSAPTVSTPVDPAPTPTAAPVSSPTEDPVIAPPAPCHLISSMTCQVLDDTMNNNSTDCSSLLRPTELECLGGVAPKQLTFKYTGETCDMSTHLPSALHRFVCIDEQPGMIANAMQVYISVNEEEPHLVSLEEEITWTGSFGSYIHVVVYEQGNDDTNNNNETVSLGAELQNVKIPTRCQARDDLTLHKSYGAFELLAFETDLQGMVSTFADVALTFLLQDSGAAAAESLNVTAEYQVFRGVERVATVTKDLVEGGELAAGAIVKYEDTVRVDLLSSTQVKVHLMAAGVNFVGQTCTEEDEIYIDVVPVDARE